MSLIAKMANTFLLTRPEGEGQSSWLKKRRYYIGTVVCTVGSRFVFCFFVFCQIHVHTCRQRKPTLWVKEELSYIINQIVKTGCGPCLRKAFQELVWKTRIFEESTNHSASRLRFQPAVLIDRSWPRVAISSWISSLQPALLNSVWPPHAKW